MTNHGKRGETPLSQPPCHPTPEPKKTRGPASPPKRWAGALIPPPGHRPTPNSFPPLPWGLVAINRNPPPAVPHSTPSLP
ncbi:hypothetical protein CMEL01_02056 [Colletotrichum melonis]|uniref:Uncharacterized protein n=1 Tax=Colletotrichum melonis TaxID=1209925 RepID=A0AAI9UIF3_9PEZI|nr:hypothetical protein CMEL01_02056 [Colletotrichum melonis]